MSFKIGKSKVLMLLKSPICNGSRFIKDKRKIYYSDTREVSLNSDLMKLYLMD